MLSMSLKIHRLQDPVYTSNVYLLEAERPVLVDTGGALKDAILRLVRDVLGDKPPAAIVFTHGHPDHIGDAEELSTTLRAPLYIHPAEGERVPAAKPIPERIDCGDARFEVIPTPGHSPGGVCLYEPSQKILISGDTVFPGGRVGRWDLPGSDYDALVQSLRKLNALEVQALYPGHYDPLTSHVAAHLQASLETLLYVGRDFDDEKYDTRIERLRESLG